MKSRSWRPWIVGGLLLVLVGLLIWSSYQFEWTWTGFTGGSGQITIQKGSQDVVLPQAKTLWDWLQLLIVPAILAAGAGFFTWWSARTERLIAQQRYGQDQILALEKQREDLLQSYLDRMADLLLKEGLRKSKDGDEVRKVARTRTVSTLIQLDGKRARIIFVFLHEAQLREASDSMISFEDTDLSGVEWSQGNLSGFNMSKANLSGANLSGANLSGANLSEANLSGACLNKANFSNAYLIRAYLSQADLFGTNLRGANLSEADLSGARPIGANLSGAFLSEANLNRAFLGGANLSNAQLTDTHLSEANLQGADLSGADLTGANFAGAYLGKANLTGANLTRANLAGAYLGEANLTRANLTRANLTGAKGLKPEQVAYYRARGAFFNKEATPLPSSSPSAPATVSQETPAQLLPSLSQATSSIFKQSVTPEAASLHEQTAVKQEVVPPMPISPAQENTSPIVQGSTAAPSSSQESNGEKRPGS